jgi:hypothetical protein
MNNSVEVADYHQLTAAVCDECTGGRKSLFSHAPLLFGRAGLVLIELLHY